MENERKKEREREREREREIKFIFISNKLPSEFCRVDLQRIAVAKRFFPKEKSLSKCGLYRYRSLLLHTWMGFRNGSTVLVREVSLPWRRRPLDGFSTGLLLVLSREPTLCPSLHHQDPSEIVELDQPNPHLYAMNYKHGRHTRLYNSAQTVVYTAPACRLAWDAFR